MIAYFVSATEEAGIAEARERGWTQVARWRFAAGTDTERHDIRLIRRMADLVPFAGRTPMIKGGDYEDGPAGATEGRLEAWIAEQQRFEDFVASGAGEWVPIP